MKVNIHPNWYKDAKVACTCGNTFTTGSTLPEIRVEICSVCHPFYTGNQKLVDTQGQVEKFTRTFEKAEKRKSERQRIQQERAAKVTVAAAPKLSLRDLLFQARKKATP